MTDYSRDRLGPQDEDRLPWLEPVEEEYEESGVGSGRLIIWLVAAIVVIGLVAGAFFWMRSNDKATSGDGALIKAPDSYYKERPGEDAPPAGGDEIVYSASKGREVESVIDTSGAAEAPVNVDKPAAAVATAPVPPSVSAPKPAPAAKPTAPAAKAAAPNVDQTVATEATKPKPAPKPAAAEPAPAKEPASGGSTIQLGAFSSQAKANSAWKNLSGRFSFLSGLTQSVIPVQSGDKTLYRLRASGGNASDICRRLRTAGESCSVVG